MASPNVAVQNPATQPQSAAVTAVTGQTPALATKNDSATASSGTDIIGDGQFSNLLAPSVKAAKSLTAIDNSNAQANTQQSASTAIPTQATGSTVIPAMPIYIDQPIAANVTTAQNNTASIGSATSGNLSNKQPIFSSLKPTNGKTATAASEVADDELDNEVSGSGSAPQTGAAQLSSAQSNTAAQPTGNISLQQLAQTTDAQQDPAFTQAVANIVSQAKIKNVNNDPAQQTLVAKLPPANNSGSQTSQSASANDNQQQQLASSASTAAAAMTKVTAKVLGVKDETIDGSDDSDQSVSPTVTANLQNFDTQLKTKSYTDVQTAQATLAPTATDQVQVKITQALNSGLATNNITVHLHPAELGSVDVDMDVDHEGNTKISITADKASTLNLLKTDSHTLTKSLADAGIKTDNASMQFNLRGDSQQSQQQAFNNNNYQQNNSNDNSAQQQANAAVGTNSAYTNLNAQTLTLTANGGLNILV